MTEKQFNKAFNTFVLVGMAVVTVLVTAVKFRGAEQGQWLLVISALGALAGVLSTVLSANGRILTFLFGFIDVSIYGAMCLAGARYGNAALHLLYFLPMQLVGFLQWKKRGTDRHNEVKARRLSKKQWTFISALFLLGLLNSYFVLAAMDKTEAAAVVKWLVLMDAFSMICNLLGQYLLSTAYMEQWIFWMAVNVFSIALWLNSDQSFAPVYIVKYSFYLINSINGLRIWNRLSKEA